MLSDESVTQNGVLNGSLVNISGDQTTDDLMGAAQFRHRASDPSGSLRITVNNNSAAATNASRMQTLIGPSGIWQISNGGQNEQAQKSQHHQPRSDDA